MAENYFCELNSINVNDKTEKKNGLTYLSWAWAWGEVKKRFPDSNYRIYEDENGCIYWTDGRTAWVKTGVIVNGIEHIEYLPVMDYKNKSIPLKDITSFDVNKAIQRSLTKALARHGLGLYIYAGEDLPEETAQKTESEPDEATKRNYIATISRLLAETETDGTKMLEFINQKYGTNAAAFSEFSAEQLIFTLRKLKEKKEKKEK